MPPTPVIAAVAIGLAAALTALYLCWKRLDGLPAAQRWSLTVLRALLLALVLAAVPNPALRSLEHKQLPALIAVAMDTSASMTDLPLGGEPRYREALGALTEGELAEALAGADALRFEVTDHARPVAEPTAEPEGAPATDLLTSLSEILRRHYPRELRACLLVSDGADDSGEPAATMAALLAAYEVPIYCLGAGSPTSLPDVSIEGVVHPRVVTEGDEFELQALIEAPSFEEEALQVALIEEGGETRRRELPGGQTQRRLKLSLTAGAPGYHRYTLAAEEREGEVSTANNRRSLLIRVEPREARLLLVEGHPRREYAFLRRLLLRFEDLETVLLLRKAEPAGIWLDTDQPRKVGGVSAAGEIDRFRAVILSNIEADALSAEWLARLARFVRAGGALAMLGGEDSFGAGGYAGGALDGVLPVRMTDSGMLANPLRARLVAEGELGRELRDSGIKGWERLPLLQGMNAVGGATGGAEVVLEAADGASLLGPIVAAGRAGAGRAVAVTADDTHRWMQSPNASETSRVAYEALWSVVLGWLLAPRVDEPVVLELDRDTYEAGALITARVQVRDEEDQPVTGANVTLRTGVGDAEMIAEPTPTAGIYRALIPAGEVGRRTIAATAELGGQVLGEDARSIDIVQTSREVALGRARPELLAAIAEASGGEYLPIERASEMARALPLGPETSTAQVALHPTRTAVWFLLVLLVAGADWLLRRRWAVG